MIDISAFEKIASRIDTYKDAMIKMQMDLTAIPAMSPDNGGDGEYEKVKYLLSQLRNAKFPNIIEIDGSAFNNSFINQEFQASANIPDN